jgi:hypothetical protein
MKLNPHFTPGISNLAALMLLSFQEGVLDITVLQYSTQLQDLQLFNVDIHNGDGADLLSFIGRPQRLQQLQLLGLRCA